MEVLFKSTFLAAVLDSADKGHFHHLRMFPWTVLQKELEDRAVSYSGGSCGTCPVLGLKGQPADNQYLLAPTPLPVSVTCLSIPTPVNLNHFSIFTVHPINGQILSLLLPYFCGLSSPLFQLHHLCHHLTWLWLPPSIVLPASGMNFLKGRSDSVTPFLKLFSGFSQLPWHD